MRRALALLVLCCAAPAWAQGIESVLMPGKLVQGHAKLEADCKQCHIRFDRQAQDRLCMGCHDKVGQDVREKAGFHGRLKSNERSQERSQACRSCHTEHKGRDARLAEFDKQRFDHALTDFALRGKHAQAECAKCHEPAHKYREAAHECNACHRKDDAHKGGLGAQCAGCHTENQWKEARFDHTKTRFALTGKHADTLCAACHKDKNYKETPRTCVACHKRDDEKKGHQGQFGDKCESCHGTRLWKTISFNHDTDTKYLLRGKHRAAECTACHTGPLYKTRTSTECVACHKKDDKHKESLGPECGSCHTERDWKERAKFDHNKTRFSLHGKHIEAQCKACHKSAVYKDTPTDCYGCHKQDDKHQATLGEKCAECHSEKRWADTAGRFDHERTQFKLRNAHAVSKLKCSACHLDLRSMRNTARDCVSCHKRDDKHEGQLGARCDQCHGDKSWKVSGFDHARTRFPLTGRHVSAACKDCHVSARFKDAQSECRACHRKDDKHQLRFGAQCESCHSTRDWKSWAFEHNQRSDFKLTGSHLKVACEQCHTRAAPAGKHIAALGANCLACHRADDVHDGSFGPRCEQCHVSESWKRVFKRVGAAPDFGASSHFNRMAARSGSQGVPQ